MKYADVVSGGKGLIVFVRLNGSRDAKEEGSFLVFKDKERSCSIQGVDDNVPNVFYRTETKGHVDGIVILDWQNEKILIESLPFGRRKFSFLERCSGHNRTLDMIEALQKINKKVFYIFS